LRLSLFSIFNFIFVFQKLLASTPHTVVVDIREGPGLCAGYPLEVEAGLMVAVTIIACSTLFAGLPLLLAAIGACQRIARKNRKGVEQSQA
jgi:hypothetical protein